MSGCFLDPKEIKLSPSNQYGSLGKRLMVMAHAVIVDNESTSRTEGRIKVLKRGENDYIVLDGNHRLAYLKMIGSPIGRC